MAGTLKITEDNFDKEVLRSKKPVLVDFWADWCHPCKIMAPIMEELAKEVEKYASITKVNVDENPILAERFDIMSIPSFIMFENGEAVKTAIGSMDKAKIMDTFRKWLT